MNFTFALYSVSGLLGWDGRSGMKDVSMAPRCDMTKQLITVEMVKMKQFTITIIAVDFAAGDESKAERNYANHVHRY